MYVVIMIYNIKTTMTTPTNSNTEGEGHNL